MHWRALILFLGLLLALPLLVTTTAQETPGKADELASDLASMSAASAPTSVVVELPGRVIGDLNLRSAPAVREDTLIRTLQHNDPLWVYERIVGEDGDDWLRVGDGVYVYAEEVRLPLPPPQVFAGRWIDVELTTPALVTAYEDDQAVYSALAIKGRTASATPSGTHEIIRRVYNETMNSETLGVPGSAPDGYYLKDVLYTQYFSPGGESLHFNYWSSDFGEEGSHGCLGLTLDDAAWLWDWADVGTIINIHG
jgi:hypothetical protein